MEPHPDHVHVVYSKEATPTNLRSCLCDLVKTFKRQIPTHWFVGEKAIPTLKALGLPYEAGSNTNRLLGAVLTTIPDHSTIIGVSSEQLGVIVLQLSTSESDDKNPDHR